MIATNRTTEGKKTLVLGASLNPVRASHDALLRLKANGHEVVAVGGREGTVANIPIESGRPSFEDLDTISLYLGPARQQDLYDYILGLNPRRIIFNPGAENQELARLAREKGIEVEFACTLVMLAVGSY